VTMMTTQNAAKELFKLFLRTSRKLPSIALAKRVRTVIKEGFVAFRHEKGENLGLRLEAGKRHLIALEKICSLEPEIISKIMDVKASSSPTK